MLVNYKIMLLLVGPNTKLAKELALHKANPQTMPAYMVADLTDQSAEVNSSILISQRYRDLLCFILCILSLLNKTAVPNFLEELKLLRRACGWLYISERKQNIITFCANLQIWDSSQQKYCMSIFSPKTCICETEIWELVW